MGEVQCNAYYCHKYVEHVSKSLLFLRCLLDSYVTNSKSRFLGRGKQSKLNFQFEAFMFSEFTENANVSNSDICCYKPNATDLQP